MVFEILRPLATSFNKGGILAQASILHQQQVLG